jgi:hypothetical protein
MGFAIEKSTKRRIIELYRNGCISPHEILNEIKNQGAKISYGSVWNVIQNYKRQSPPPTTKNQEYQPKSAADHHQQQITSEGDLQQQQEEVKTPNQEIPKTSQLEEVNTAFRVINNGPISISNDSPSSPSGDGPKSAEPAPKTKNPGAPFSFLDNSTGSGGPKNKTSDPLFFVDAASAIVTEADFFRASLEPETIHPTETKQINITESTNERNATKNASFEEEAQEEEFKQPKHFAATSLPTSQDPSRTTIDFDSEEEPAITESNSNSEMDWDSDENWTSRVFREIRAAKKERHDELELINQRWQELNKHSEQLAQQKHDLEVRESQFAETLLQFDNKYIDILPLLPSLRELQSLGLDPHQMLTWTETVRSLAGVRNIDIKTASNLLREELELYRQMGGLQNRHQQMTQQLTVLEVFVAQNQAAVKTVMDLKSAGFSDQQIMELTKVVEIWNQGNPPAMNQGNGSSRGNNGFKWDTELLGMKKSEK